MFDKWSQLKEEDIFRKTIDIIINLCYINAGLRLVCTFLSILSTVIPTPFVSKFLAKT